VILRYLISVIFLSVMIAIAPLSVQADTNESTSIELYEQGMQLFETGQYAEARKVLWDLKLVPADLSPEQRVAMWSTMQKIDQQVNASEDPQQLLAQAQEVQSAGQLVEAQKINRQVINSGKSTDKQKSLAQTRLADIKRQLEPQIVSLRHQIDAARADINANQLDEATAKLQAVKQSPVSLGWYDQQSISQLLAKIDERREQRLALANDSSKYDAVTQKGKAQKNTETTANKPRGKSSPGYRLSLRDNMKLLAQQHMEDGRRAELRGEFHLAAKHYAEAVGLDPDNEQATAALEAAREKAQAKSTPTGPLQRQLEIQELQRQEAVSEYKQLMNRAGVMREERRFTEALELVNQAKAMLDRNKNVIPSGQYNRLRLEAERLDKDIGQERRIAEAEDQKQTEQQAKALAVEVRMAAEQEKYLVTQDLLKQAIDLLAEQKYKEAMDKLDYAEFWDPGNPAVQALIHSAEITQAIAESKAIRKDRTQAVVKHSLGNLRATYPQPEILAYPPDWPEITRKRLFSTGQNSVEDKMNRAVKIKLQQPIQEVDFDTQALDYAIDFIRQITETNIYVNWNALRDAGIDEDTTINLKLNNVPANHALALLLRQVSTDLDPVTYSIRKGIVEISTRQDLTMATVTKTYDIQDLMFTVKRFSNAPSFDLNQALSNTNSGGSGTGSSSTSGSGGGGGGGGNTSGGGSGNNQSGWDTDTDDVDDEQPTRLEVVENLVDLIRNTVGRPDEWVELGGSVSSLRELNGTLIIRTTTDNHQEVTTLLNQLRDARAVQISVEARFLLVDQNFLEDIGADVDITISDVGGKWGDIVISQDSFGVTAAPSTGFPGGFLPIAGGAAGAPSGRSLDLSLSYLDDLQVSLLVRASQQHRRSITLTAPRLTLMNGQQAFLYVARQISFVSDVEPIADAIGFDPTLSVLNEGVVLDVEATVSADRRYVTMTAMPSLSTIVKPIRKETQTVLFTTEDDPDTPDIDESSERLISASIEVPEAEITEIKTTVSVPDRGTLLMGGQRLVGEVEVEAGVPVLSKIPFLNRIFTNRSTVKDERTLLILIKPTIIIQSEEEEQNFPNIPDMLNNPAEYDRSSQYAF